MNKINEQTKQTNRDKRTNWCFPAPDGSGAEELGEKGGGIKKYNR